MSNILKVTTPVTGYDTPINKQNQQQTDDLSIKNPVAPDKVVRPDGKQGSGGKQEVRQGISYESNFGNFVQSLRDVPRLREVMNKMLFSGMAGLVEAGIKKGTVDEIQNLFQMLQVSPEQLKDFLKSQMAGANRMQGPLFDLMRQMMKDASTVELKAGILDFLKKYNDMSSSEHLLSNIKGELKEMEGYMFQGDRDALRALAARLRSGALKNNQRNVALLKNEIIPFLGKHIAETKNMGTLRDLVTLLAFNTSRYENASMDGLTQAFQRLMNFPAFQKAFGGMDAKAFRDMFNNVDFDKAAGKTAWSDSLLNIIKAGVKGEAGIENREAFLNIVSGMLANESVYMPVMHAMLPMIINGVPVFSEIWVDPNEESAEQGSTEKGVKLLLKFDMKDVGFFDLLLYYENGKVDMRLQYPENLSKHEKEIREDIGKIIKKNKMDLEYFAVEKGKESIPVSAAFPKIFERRNTVNVTI